MNDPMAFDQTVAGGTTCPNCNAPASPIGEICPSCGQNNARKRLRLNDLARDALAGLTDIEGPWLKTMGALIPHCGDLASDYVDGRRARYVSPVRLFLMLLIVLFVGQELSTTVAETTGSGSRWLPFALLLYVMPIALVLRVVFMRANRTVAEISVLVLYAMSAIILLWMVIGLGIVIALAIDGAWTLIDETLLGSMALIAIYLGFSARHFFHCGLIYALIAASSTALLMFVGFAAARQLFESAVL